MPARPLEVLVIAASAQGAVIHQLQGDMDWDTFIFGHDLPFVIDVLQNI